MTDAATSGARREVGVVAALATGGACALFWHLCEGPVMWPLNATQPTGVAASLARGGGFEVPGGDVFATAGPLYPLLLAPAAWAGVPAVAAVAAIAAAGWAVGVTATFVLAREAAGADARWAWLATLVVAALASQTELLRVALPDGLVVSLSLAAVAAALRAREDKRWAWVAGALAGLAAVGRYIALATVVPVCAVVVAHGIRSRPAPGSRRSGGREALVVAALGAAPIGAWMLRNLALTGHTTGMSRVAGRALSRGHELPDHAWGAVHTAALDLFSFDRMGLLVEVYRGVPDLPGLFGVAAACAFAVVGLRGRPPAAVACVALAVAHVLGSVALWTFTNSDPLMSRYLSPAWPPLVVALAAAGASAPGARRAAVLGLMLWLLAANASKSAQLLGDRPPLDLMQWDRHHRWGRVWRTSIPWEPAEVRPRP